MHTKTLQELLNKIEKFVKTHNHHYPSTATLSRRFKLRFISAGCSRRVFNSIKFPELVIKIQTSNSKKSSPNNSEFRFYKRARVAQRKLLAKPCAISKDYVVMAMEKTPHKVARKAEVVKFVNRAKRILPVSHRWDMESINFFGNVPRCPHNIGTAPSGELKLFDYATMATT